MIIGAGSAGCALASRLTKNRNITVLVLETGKPEMILTDVPAMAPIFQDTDFVWHYYMEPQSGVCMGKQFHLALVQFTPRRNGMGETFSSLPTVFNIFRSHTYKKNVNNKSYNPIHSVKFGENEIYFTLVVTRGQN